MSQNKAVQQGVESAPPNLATGQASNGRRWLFRLLAGLGVPLFLLGLLELVLRLTGYGHATSFFLEREQDGERVLVENDKFGWRFFPRGMARSPSPQIIRATKPAGTYRIFLFGESAALGDPKPAYGVGRYLEVLLGERFSGTKFEVVCVAMTAINSHAILPIARECVRYQGDLWILYLGNNEMEGPFGASPVLGAGAQSLGIIRATLALRATRIGQLIQDLGDHFKGRGDRPQSWEGMKMFLAHQLTPDDAIKQVVHQHFQKNLEDIVRTGLDVGVHPVLCTVASNLRDCAPFASAHGRGLSDAQREHWAAVYDRGVQMESSNQFFAASQVFEQAGETDSRFAELQFRAGRCAERLTNYAAAKAHYERARDADALPFRADAALNSTTREVARRFADRGAKLIDAEAELARQSPHEITGQEFFHDHVHLTFEGNYRLARLLARQVEDSLPSAILRLRQNDWATAVVCEGRLGLTDWNRNAAYEAMLLRFAEAPFTNQLNHASRAQALVEKIMQTRARMHPRVFLDTRAIYEEALAKNSRDHWLSENFAEFLEATGEIEEAIAQWRRVAAALPHHFAAFFHVGRLLRQQAKYPEAIAQLVKALALRPDLADGRLELGQARLDSGQPEAALADFITVRRQHPEDARVHVQVASALAALNRRGEATTSLREAIRLRPPYWEAHYLLGVELAGASHFAAAELEFTEVIRLRPNYASAHFNLAVALAKQARLDQAVAEFQETLRLDPNHQTARQYLQSLKPSPRE